MKTINFFEARKRLFKLWMIFAGVIFSIYFIQTIMGRYDGYQGDVWEWLFKYITPSLTLMIGVFINEIAAKPNTQEVEIFYFKTAYWISLFFLIVLLLSSFFIPFLHLMQNKNIPITQQQKPIMEAVNSYSIFLIPLQGLTTLSLGLFFTKKEKEKEKGEAENPTKK